MTELLLCCDLDRTVLPNGSQQESPQARTLFRMVAQRPELTLAYVSGRDQSLLLEAIHDYDLPVSAAKGSRLPPTVIWRKGERVVREG